MDPLSELLNGDGTPDTCLHERGYQYVAGVDEAGRGPLAGPVVASAVVFAPHWSHPEIADSKTLSPKKRENLFCVIRESALAWNWALVEPDEIDRINILRAALLAMKKAVECLSLKPGYIIVDGPHPISSNIPQTPIKRGDQKSLAIAAASIMAKVVRDAIMGKYHTLYPRYNFAKNKGYGTREHLDALVRFGCCPIHRKSFKKVVPEQEG